MAVTQQKADREKEKLQIRFYTFYESAKFKLHLKLREVLIMKIQAGKSGHILLVPRPNSHCEKCPNPIQC